MSQELTCFNLQLPEEKQDTLFKSVKSFFQPAAPPVQSLAYSVQIPTQLLQQQQQKITIPPLVNNTNTLINKNYWMRDENVRECYDCKNQFTTFRRKHHCRICGQIFCFKCASAIVSGDMFGYAGDMRVCNFCVKTIIKEYPNSFSYSHDKSHSVNSNSSKYSLLDFHSDSNRFKRTPMSDIPDLAIRDTSTEKLDSATESLNSEINEISALSDDDDALYRDDEWGITPVRYHSLGEISTTASPKSNNPDTYIQTRPKIKRRSFTANNIRSKLKIPPRSSSRKSILTTPLIEGLEIHSQKYFKTKHNREPSIPSSIELNHSSLLHLNRILNQILLKKNIPLIASWNNVISRLALQVCDNVVPDVRLGDDQDIRHYVKIKRIPGGNPSDSHYVDGVVFTKNVAHKKMIGPKSNPKVLLLTFALEYQRVENEFISLEPVLSQEREHLKNLVSRVVALKPDIVLIQKTVSRIALEFLLEAGVVVAFNIKVSVIEAVARCTNADILSSIDKLALDPKLGTCSQFFTKTYQNDDIPGIRKTYMYFKGCKKELGSTLVLRGDNLEILGILKEITQFMCFVAYSLKLETHLLRDQFSQIKQHPEILAEAHAESIENINLENLSGMSVEDKLQMIISAYEATMLSCSPLIKFPPPYLVFRKYQAEKLGHSLLSKKKSTEFETKQFNHEFLKPDLKTFPYEDDEMIISAIDSSRPMTQSSKIEKERADMEYIIEKAKKAIDPFASQNIVILYSNLCKSLTDPCQPPELQLIEYYRDSDLTLGQYIEDLCLTCQSQCYAKGAENILLNHRRIYTHGNGKIVISMKEHKCPVQGMEDVILMWSTCNECGESTPYSPISEETWKYSFGKYLELSFYQSELICRADICPHLINRSHKKFFGWKNLAIEVEYFEIRLFEVAAPPKEFEQKPDFFIKFRHQDAEIIKEKIASFFDSITERIKNFSYDMLSPNKVPQCKEIMLEMNKRCSMEKKFYLQLLQQTMVSTHPTDANALNTVTKALLDNVSSWDSEFNSFIRAHVQPDSRDIRRVTASQIKKMFTERENLEPKLNGQPIVNSESIAADVEKDSKISANVESIIPLLGSSPTFPKLELSNKDSFMNRRHSIKLMHEFNNLNGITFPSFGTSPSTDGEFLLPKEDFNLPFKFEAIEKSSDYESPNIDVNTQDSFQLSNQNDVTPLRSEVESNFETQPLPYSPSFSKKQNIGLEDDQPSEWNTISGVAVETESDLDEDFKKSHEALNPGERTSIMKTITNLWTGNPGNLLPLEYPTSTTEHFFPDSLIIVREDEPTSIIAFTLGSKHYKEKLLAKQNGSEINKQPAINDENSRYSIELDDQFGDIEETLMRVTGTHIRYQFWDKTTRLQCKIYFAEQFSALRKNCGIEDTFVKSLSRCVKWDATGGKSGSTFLKSRDNRFVIKQLSRSEMDALYKFATAYFEYMSQAFFHELPTVLAKIFGFYRIGFKNAITGRSIKMDVVIMENLFIDRKITKIFDLKGSVRNRHVKSTGNQYEVLLDENLVQLIYESPLFIREHSKKLLRASVWNDTLFLSKLNVMDYSLLVGIDEEKNELVLGIVDFIRTFTWDKKLESWVKETGILGGGGKEPTIVSPRQYKARFREAMERYFMMAPDKYTQV